MPWLWGYVLPLGVMVLAHLAGEFYQRRREGPQPHYIGLLIMSVSVAAVLLLFHGHGLGLEHHGVTRDVCWLALTFAWLGFVVWVVYQRRSSGGILMDLGRSLFFKLQIFCGAVTAATAIPSAWGARLKPSGLDYLV